MEINKQQFTAVYLQDGKWFLGWIEELPGVNVQGITMKEVKDNLDDALRMVLQVNKDLLIKEITEERYAKIVKEPIFVSVAR